MFRMKLFAFCILAAISINTAQAEITWALGSADSFSIAAHRFPVYLKPADSNEPLLDKRKSTIMPGVSGDHHMPYGFMRASLVGNVLDNSDGVVWDMAWLYLHANGGFTLTPGVGIEWSSPEQNTHYYRASRKKPAYSGLQRYKPDDGWAPYFEISANYSFPGNWGIYSAVRYTRQSDGVTDTPVSDKLWNGVFSTGITYWF